MSKKQSYGFSVKAKPTRKENRYNKIVMRNVPIISKLYRNDLLYKWFDEEIKNELKNLRMQILGYFCHFLLHLTTYVLFFSHSLFSGIHEWWRWYRLRSWKWDRGNILGFNFDWLLKNDLRLKFTHCLVGAWWQYHCKAGSEDDFVLEQKVSFKWLRSRFRPSPFSEVWLPRQQLYLHQRSSKAKPKRCAFVFRSRV